VVEVVVAVVVVVVIAAMAAEAATAIDAVVVGETVVDCLTQRFAEGQPPPPGRKSR